MAADPQGSALGPLATKSCMLEGLFLYIRGTNVDWFCRRSNSDGSCKILRRRGIIWKWNHSYHRTTTTNVQTAGRKDKDGPHNRSKKTITIKIFGLVITRTSQNQSSTVCADLNFNGHLNSPREKTIKDNSSLARMVKFPACIAGYTGLLSGW